MKLKNYRYPAILSLIVMAAWACNKSGDDAPVVGATSKLNVINAVTDIRAIDFYLNGVRQNTNSAIYLFNASGYNTVLTGEQQYQFKNDTLERAILADIKLNPAKADSSYTMILAGQQSKNNLATIFMSDYFPSDTSTKARVRFVQASPGTTSYDIFVGDTLSFKNQAYKAFTSFQKVGAGKKTVKVNVAGTTNNVFTGTIVLQKNSFYTVYTAGQQGGTGTNALGVSANLSR
ncbi:DUF4397 domain-containing protein [Mucilaginibacter boryungensis]|uniref:DUF4397 domain-containing protein n=1 Tax=Mucilaginibacter boryungensis TaxID=768480 RepID=A0ABR9XCP7_9SPHI|nr:DUF4397 domain-containing protein [Mucilaginibacter boryungensis]MBE9664942.1 DUF4397 domain-containing protein [Mucilaginibacter boryungensis]